MGGMIAAGMSCFFGLVMATIFTMKKKKKYWKRSGGMAYLKPGKLQDYLFYSTIDDADKKRLKLPE